VLDILAMLAIDLRELVNLINELFIGIAWYASITYFFSKVGGPREVEDLATDDGSFILFLSSSILK
jgi:hypothetical protein